MPLRSLILLLLLVPLSAQILQINAPSSLRSGIVAIASVELVGSPAAGLQFTIDLPGDVSSVHSAPGPQAILASKVITCGAISAGACTCILYGTASSASMNPGVVAFIFGIRGGATSALVGSFRMRAARIVDSTGQSQAPLLLYQSFPPEFRLDNPNTARAAGFRVTFRATRAIALIRMEKQSI